jgi:hypothetical protein
MQYNNVKQFRHIQGVTVPLVSVSRAVGAPCCAWIGSCSAISLLPLQTAISCSGALDCVFTQPWIVQLMNKDMSDELARHCSPRPELFEGVFI